MDIPLLHAGRLTGHLFAPSDSPDLRALFNDPRVMKSMGTHGTPMPHYRFASVEARFLDMTEDGPGFGLWVFRGPKGGFVGYCGLRREEVRGRLENELLYTVGGDYHGLGQATLMARVVLAWGRAHGITDVVAYTTCDNIASRRVMEKMGLTEETTFHHARLDHVLYRRTD
ncbi:GNAT family N-acetyltransferase [Roseospirillum parvum]|uniref:Protein N-acetyltransferase, RimJ/RimL family n=1 Tax=Roseospirillum parvum TaxID=83401 RepID=A0A1G7VA52_9PROT|nr:GNAT family N-acetyltransferase [Roseospirillum parvum]SDG56755.1 Protein N-acetyltransferase, RimJ/RimL family [Roseospirillum parvum]